MSELLGFIGTFLALIAYIPQIFHLIYKKCSAGISLKTFAIWFLSSALLLWHAASIHSTVFILFQAGNLISVTIILLFGYAYRNKRCKKHNNLYEKEERKNK